MSILKLTEDNLNDRIFIRTQDDFSNEGILISISDNFYELKDSSGDVTRIYEFEIGEIAILSSKDNKNKDKPNETNTESYVHPVFGKLSRVQNQITFLKLNHENIDLNTSLDTCKYVYIDSYHALFDQVCESLSRSDAIGLSCYSSSDGDMKILNISNGQITMVVDLSEDITRYCNQLKQIISSKLCITCKGSSLIEFIQQILDIKMSNFIDLQIFHFGLHNLKLAQVLSTPVSYTSLVHTLFGFQFKQLTSSNVEKELIIEKMSYNSHFLVPIYRKFQELLIEPVKCLSRRLCVPQLDSEKLLGREGRPSVDFDKLPRSLQFWSYKESTVFEESGVFSQNSNLFLKKYAGKAGLNEHSVIEDSIEIDKVCRKLASDIDNKDGRTNRGYSEEMDEDEISDKWLKELKHQGQSREFLSDNEDLPYDEALKSVSKASDKMLKETNEKTIIQNHVETDVKSRDTDQISIKKEDNPDLNHNLKKSRGIGRGRGRKVMQLNKVMENAEADIKSNEKIDEQFENAEQHLCVNLFNKVKINGDSVDHVERNFISKSSSPDKKQIHSNYTNEKSNTGDQSFFSKSINSSNRIDLDDNQYQSTSFFSNSNKGFLSKDKSPKIALVKTPPKSNICRQKADFITPPPHNSMSQFEDAKEGPINIDDFLCNNDSSDSVIDVIEIKSSSSEDNDKSSSRPSDKSSGFGRGVIRKNLASNSGDINEEHYCEYRFFGGSRAGLSGRPGVAEPVNWKKPGLDKPNIRKVSGRVNDKSNGGFLKSAPTSYGRGIFWTAGPPVGMDTDDVTDKLYKEFDL